MTHRSGWPTRCLPSGTMRLLALSCSLGLLINSCTTSQAFTASSSFQLTRFSPSADTAVIVARSSQCLSSLYDNRGLSASMTLSNGPGPEAIVARVTNAWRSARGGKDVKIEGKMRGGKERSGSILRAFSGGSDPPRRGGTGSWGWGGGGGGGDGGDGGGERGMAVLGRNELGALGYAQVLAMAGSKMRNRSSYSGGRRRSPNDRETYRRARRPGKGQITVTKALIAINVLMYLVQMRYPSVTSAGWKMASAITQNGQWYRLLTPVVLHGSVSHLVINSLSLNSVGPVVEQVMGKTKFMAVYILAGISGNALSCIINPRMPAVGASGAIFGMVGAFGAFCAVNKSVLGRQNTERALRGVGQTLALNLVLGMSSTQIDNMGHIGGFLGGAATTLLIGPRLRRRTNPLTGEVYTVDLSPKLALPRFLKRADRNERLWP